MLNELINYIAGFEGSRLQFVLKVFFPTFKLGFLDGHQFYTDILTAEARDIN